MEVTEVHEPISYALIVVDSKNEIIFQKYYCGVDAVNRFLQILKKISLHVMNKLREYSLD